MIERFNKDGYVVLPGFYDVEADILPIQEDIRKVVALVARKYNIDAPCDTADQAMREGFMAIARANRAWASEIYDSVKQIPSFMQLVSNKRNADLYAQIRPHCQPGLAAAGYGIRIDLPAEDKFRANWHQEFPAQLRSLDGVVFWTPLLPVTSDLGPVEICVGSHRDGVVPVFRDNGGVGKSGAYALRLDKEEERLAKYNKVAPLSKPGDLVLMDFLTLHQSGTNKENFPRWSMQSRWFNFNDPVGIKIGWKGSFADGVNFENVLPELLA